jgi:N-methylhydantoinase B/oxoprolinase/acetone carboxylase alpha subunit
MERDPAVVLSDVTNGYVSVEKARETYGVIIDERSGVLALNEALTRKTRAESALSAREGGDG